MSGQIPRPLGFGFGRGRGRGFGRWWAYPYYGMGYGYPYYGAGYGYPYSGMGYGYPDYGTGYAAPYGAGFPTGQVPPEEELKMLKDNAQALQQEMEAINKRIAELSKKEEK
jgi:hypothetical protein